jgi:pantetheine-phosphate adenylyltransferase
LLFPGEPALELETTNRSANLRSYQHEAGEIVLNGTFIWRSGSMGVLETGCVLGFSMTQGDPKSRENSQNIEMTKAFYTGSFDPMTNGHLDVLVQALNIARTVIVGIGANSKKTPMFTFEERAMLIRESVAAVLAERASDVDVISFDNLAVDAARKVGATIIVRGLRSGSDFDFEMEMAGMNQKLAPDIQTVFVPATPASRPITATLVRQIAEMGGDVSAFVPAPVLQALKNKRKS